MLDSPTQRSRNTQENRTSYCCHGSLTGLHLRHGSRGPPEESRCPMHISMYVQPVLESITYNNFPDHPLYQNTYFFTSQHVLSAIANMLLDIAGHLLLSEEPLSRNRYCFYWSHMEDSLVELWEWLLPHVCFGIGAVHLHCQEIQVQRSR